MLKSEISYLDENNNIVDREKATHSIIRQTDEEGNLYEWSNGKLSLIG